jgi:hypothetical protein
MTGLFGRKDEQRTADPDNYTTWDSVSTGGEYPTTFYVCPVCFCLVGQWWNPEKHIAFHRKAGDL